MKVLIVSHTVISRTNNMGKTVLSYFRAFDKTELAQFYFHNMVPEESGICVNYYRFTDKDALRALLPGRERGRVFTEADMAKPVPAETTGADAGLYHLGARRTSGVYFARNLLWSTGRWKTAALRKWICDFAPDVVFFMSGDYAFMYDVACWAAEIANAPLVLSCVDDYYTNNVNAGSWLGRAVYRGYMRTVRRTMDRCAGIFAICDSMSRCYSQMFGVPCHTLHTAAARRELALAPGARQVSYIGNLILGRNEQLAAMGRALLSLGLEDCPYIDVYSGETDSAITACLTEENGIRFHGSIPPEEVLQVMARSRAVIHTESFDPTMVERVRYSVSTKIAESLMYGPCLIAYGPEGIASMDYLKENKAAYCITSPDTLAAGLREVLTDSALRGEILTRARDLAERNHSEDANPQKLRQWLQEIVDGAKGQTE